MVAKYAGLHMKKQSIALLVSKYIVFFLAIVKTKNKKKSNHPEYKK